MTRKDDSELGLIYTTVLNNLRLSFVNIKCIEHISWVICRTAHINLKDRKPKYMKEIPIDVGITYMYIINLTIRSSFCDKLGWHQVRTATNQIGEIVHALEKTSVTPPGQCMHRRGLLGRGLAKSVRTRLEIRIVPFFTSPRRWSNVMVNAQQAWAPCSTILPLIGGRLLTGQIAVKSDQMS